MDRKTLNANPTKQCMVLDARQVDKMTAVCRQHHAACRAGACVNNASKPKRKGKACIARTGTSHTVETTRGTKNTCCKNIIIVTIIIKTRIAKNAGVASHHTYRYAVHVSTTHATGLNAAASSYIQSAVYERMQARVHIFLVLVYAVPPCARAGINRAHIPTWILFVIVLHVMTSHVIFTHKTRND